MTVDSMTGAAEVRCPRCAARIRADAAWCTLCYADLRPPPPPPPAPVSPESERSTGAAAATSSMTAAGEFDPLTAPLALLEHNDVQHVPTHAKRVATTGWPCATCGATVPLDSASCTSCGAGFLAGMIPEDPVLGKLSKGPISNQVKALIMIGGSVGLLVLILGFMYLVGTIF